MTYYWLSTEDERNVNWVLYRADPERRLRERYVSLSCQSCGRVDEQRALELGFDADVCIKSKLDFLTSDDGFVCVSRRGREVFEENGFQGLQFLSLPGQAYSVVWPTQRFHVKRMVVEERDEEVFDLEAIASDPKSIASARKTIVVETDACGMEFRDKCKGCGRHFETLHWPRLESMTLPDDPLLIGAPELSFETPFAQETWLLATGKVAKTLQQARLRGLELVAAT